MAEKAMSDPMAMAGKLEFWWITRLRSKVFSLESLWIWFLIGYFTVENQMILGPIFLSTEKYLGIKFFLDQKIFLGSKFLFWDQKFFLDQNF